MVNPVPRTLAGRYEVGELIGRGGMAEVHIGHDNRLGRTVAIKILRSDLARDPSFQARFRREAQAAASLNHPAIVAVYDTGEDTYTEPTGAISHVPFIVMEYVEGHTVRDILRDGNAVPIEEAIEITAGVLSALEYSHHAGIVHRDIKPANVMLTPTGAVKVMDFGIARAVADSSSAMTQTHSVIGTAQYLSPEQARGESVDTRSDLYSTGCLLYELLTGRPPFTGDSPVAVAYQHVRELAAPPSTIAPDVPHVLDQITLKALAKDRNERYSTAAEFRAALEAAARGEMTEATAAFTPVPAPPVDPQATQVIPQQMGAPAPVPSFAAATAAPNGQSPATSAMPWQQAPAESALFDQDDDEDDNSGKKRLIWTLVSVAVIAILAIIAIKLMSGGNDEPVPVTMPVLTDMDENAITAELKSAGFTNPPLFNQELSDDVKEGLFVRANHEAGDSLDPATNIEVWLSSGPNVAVVPDVTGRTQDEARKMLEDAKFKVGSVTSEANSAEKDTVVRTDPAANKQVAAGTTVDIFVSNGFVDLPNVVGMQADDARDQLRDLKFEVKIEERPTDEIEDGSVKEGEVVEQSPGEGSYEAGTTVTLYKAVPVPIEKVQVPNLANRPWDDAQSELFAAGLVGEQEQINDNNVPEGSVIRTIPDAGTEVDTGTKVTVYVSLGPVQAPEPDPNSGDNGDNWQDDGNNGDQSGENNGDNGSDPNANNGDNGQG